ncbi:hypothetical protein V1291_004795 [Nitrobacteraceae bacterium AZCC 1564]
MRNRLTVATLLALLGLIVGVERAVAQPAPTPGQSPFFPGFGESPFFPQLGPPTQAPAVQAPRARRVEAPRARRVVIPTPRTQRKPRVVRPAVARPAPANLRKIAEEKGFKRVSDLVNFPKFFPGLGIIFVKPETLPLGPFLCFDRKDRLMATVYMVPIKDFNDHKTLEAPAFAGAANHTSIYFNPGHPGVDMPHYHFVIWHVSKKEEERVAK